MKDKTKQIVNGKKINKLPRKLKKAITKHEYLFHSWTMGSFFKKNGKKTTIRTKEDAKIVSAIKYRAKYGEYILQREDYYGDGVCVSEKFVEKTTSNITKKHLNSLAIEIAVRKNESRILPHGAKNKKFNVLSERIRNRSLEILKRSFDFKIDKADYDKYMERDKTEPYWK